MITKPKPMRDFELEVYFSEWEFTAEHHMTASDLESMTVNDLLSMATEEDRAAFENLWLGYTPTWGSAELRQEIANTYQTINPDEVLCLAGAGEGYMHWLNVCLQAEITLSFQPQTIRVLKQYH